ncbi:MAG: GntR family transcriptional regulator [Spartobacteria bacterium]|nr:GntR family transcriptional regulator [Spartobacteria bacterium]
MMSNTIDKGRRVPMYVQCAGVLRSAIGQGRYTPGEFLPAERELSREFGVNRLTLRKGLAELVREGLLENIPGAGNRVVRQAPLCIQRFMVACVMQRQGPSPERSPFYADILQGIEGVVSPAGHDLVVATMDPADLWGADGRPCAVPRNLKSHFDGVILIDGITDALIMAYQKRGVPVALVDRPCSLRGVAGVTIDNFNGARTAAQYLIERGHTRMAYVGALPDPVSGERFNGFRAGLEEAGLGFSRRDFIEAGYLIESAHEAMLKYVRKNRSRLPTAVCAINDETAIGVMKALQESSIRIPDDMAVMGFDDISWAAHTNPPLSTVRMPRKQMGELAAQMLLRQLTHPSEPRSSLVLQTELVPRVSA